MAWNRRHVQRLLARFRPARGVEPARAFGRTLVGSGLLSDRDVEEALNGTGAERP